jgi:fused signal recognition particle receptor
VIEQKKNQPLCFRLYRILRYWKFTMELRRKRSHWLLLMVVCTLFDPEEVQAFSRGIYDPAFLAPNGKRQLRAEHRQAVSSTTLYMVFDFFRERSKEGLDQLQNLSNAAARGQLGKGLQEAAVYTQQTNQAFAVGLAKSRNRFLADIEALWTGVSSEDILEELQDILLQADLGIATADDIVQEVRSLQEDSTSRMSKDDLKSIMRGKLIEALNVGPSRAIRFEPSATEAVDGEIAQQNPHIPTVLFIMGANGMGKTTTIGKLAHRLRTEGNQSVLLAACDTFRAGAVEQLQLWADRAEVAMIGPSKEGMKPSAVLYEALTQAIADKVDTVIVDTSGRLSNNENLTQELAKMIRVIQTKLSLETDRETNKPIPNPDVPHEILLVIDAAQGRMALDSAKVWNEALSLTGLILTKLDGSARGGSVVAVSRDLALPVKLVGIGEGINDLRDVRKESSLDACDWCLYPSSLIPHPSLYILPLLLSLV